MKFCPRCGKEYANNLEICSVDGAALIVVGGNAEPVTGGTFAGRYQIVEKIGQGGMGAVYKAIHTRMNRTCAIKLLAAEQAEGQAAVERFHREAQMASSIGNPHAVVIYDFGETEDGVLYLVMEYVEGEPLSRALLRERTFTPGRACAIAQQVADALGAAHALGIVHRDLKPDNVMLSKREAGTDYVKVLDFGIAKAVSHDAGEDLTQTGFVLGTPAYMSPEQLSGDKLDARSDIYSLALIVYQMLSGKLPFEGESTQARLIKRLTDSPVPLRTNAPSVTAELEAAVMAGLARNRDDRPASAALFACSLDACIPGESGGASGATLPIWSMPASLGAAGGPARPTSPQSGSRGAQGSPTGADSVPTIPISAEVTNANDPATEGFESPSSYVTRQSTTPMVSDPGGGPAHGSAERPGLGSSEVAGRAAEPPGQGLAEHAGQVLPEQGSQAPTRQSAFEQARPSAPETVAVAAGASQVSATRVGPRAAPTAHGLSHPAGHPVKQQGGSRKSAVGLLIAVMAIGLLLVSVGGIVVYLKYFRNAKESRLVSEGPVSSPGPSAGRLPTPAPTAQAAATAETPLAGTASSAAASAHFAAGKRHQEQARMLAGSGSASQAGEEYRKAIAEYQEAIKLQPMNPEVHENLGVALYDLGRVGDAADEYNVAIDQYSALRNAPTAQVMVNYGLALFDSKRYRDAAGAFGRALQLDPGDHDLYALRGFALQNAGDYESAKQDYHQYLSREPSGQYADAVKQILAGRAQPPSQTGNR